MRFWQDQSASCRDKEVGDKKQEAAAMVVALSEIILINRVKKNSTNIFFLYSWLAFGQSLVKQRGALPLPLGGDTRQVLTRTEMAGYW